MSRIVAGYWMDSVSPPSLPGAGAPKGTPPVYRRAEILVSWPLENLGASLPNLMATVAGPATVETCGTAVVRIVPGGGKHGPGEAPKDKTKDWPVLVRGAASTTRSN